MPTPGSKVIRANKSYTINEINCSQKSPLQKQRPYVCIPSYPQIQKVVVQEEKLILVTAYSMQTR